MAIEVIFTYDEAVRKWEAIVEGAKDDIEARQSFSAVVLTCQLLEPALLIHTRTERQHKPWPSWRITPAV